MAVLKTMDQQLAADNPRVNRQPLVIEIGSPQSAPWNFKNQSVGVEFDIIYTGEG